MFLMMIKTFQHDSNIKCEIKFYSDSKNFMEKYRKPWEE